MKFFTQPTAFFLFLSIEFCATAFAEMVPYTKQWDVKLHSLLPSEVLTKLDIDRPGLESVKEAVGEGDPSHALAELLRYYRGKYPSSPVEHEVTQQTIEAADHLCRHVFQWGPYKPVDYGPDIDWTINPANDIEWVAAVYRFYWATDLEKAVLIHFSCYLGVLGTPV